MVPKESAGPSHANSLFSPFQFFSHSHGAGILEVRLVSFVNEGWRDVLGSCCGESSPSNGDTGPTSTCTTPCTPFFRICLKQWQNPVQPEGPCYYGSRVTEVFNGNTASDPLSPGAVLRVDLAHSAGYQEPIKFPFSFSWTVSVHNGSPRESWKAKLLCLGYHVADCGSLARIFQQ